MITPPTKERTFLRYPLAFFLAVLLLGMAFRVQAATIPDLLQPYVTGSTMAGAVTLVATGDTILNFDAVGYADIAGNKPMTTDALFWIASMNKAMTCAAMMMLVDEGRVSVDDPVEKYLPEFKGQLVWDGTNHTTTHTPPHPMLVREIMCHTSGLRASYDIDGPTGDAHPLSVLVQNYAAVPLEANPGTVSQYSNPGINTTGRIIEVVSGMPYEQFMAQRLFTPLGMVDTTFWPTTAQLQRLAKSYQANATKKGLVEYYVNQLYYPLNDTVNRYAMPAGGLFSTTSDVAKFCQMLLNGGVYGGKCYLSLAAVRQMMSKQTGDLVSTSYGFGLGVNGGDISHAGAYKTNMDINLQLGLVRVFMVQQGSNWPNNVGNDDILNAFNKAASNMAQGSISRTPAAMTTGTIVMQDNFSYTTGNINNHLPTTGTTKWSAPTGTSIVSTDGTKANCVLTSGTDPMSYNATVSMPFVPKSNTLYTLSATFNYSGPVNRDCWVGLGFSTGVAGSDPPWMLVRPQATSTTDAGAAGTHGSFWLPGWPVYAAFFPNITATITLNTLTNEARFFINGFYEASTTLTAPNIQNLYFQAFKNSDILTIKNITLTEMSVGAWAKSCFSADQQSNSAIVGATAIPQKDGAANLLKYYCNINPAVPMSDADRAALPVAQMETIGSKQYLTLAYRKNAWAAGVNSSVQVCTDLSANSWQTATPDTTRIISTDYLTGDQTVKVGVDVTGNTKKFIRLRVTGP